MAIREMLAYIFSQRWIFCTAAVIYAFGLMSIALREDMTSLKPGSQYVFLSTNLYRAYHNQYALGKIPSGTQSLQITPVHQPSPVSIKPSVFPSTPKTSPVWREKYIHCPFMTLPTKSDSLDPWERNSLSWTWITGRWMDRGVY